jgi:ankyrin repeat protein
VCLEVEHGDKPLDIACMEAVAAGDALLLKTLHQHFNADLSTCDPSNGVTLLHTAAFRGDHDILSYLLQHTSNHQVRTLQASLTVAHWAAQGGSLTCLSLLHQHNIELLRVQDCVGNTPLHYAAQFGHADAVEFLISLNEHLDQLHNSHSPSMIDIQNLRGLTPLHWAAFGNHDRAASVLLCEGASVDIVDAEGRTPLHLAAARGSMQVALKLVYACFFLTLVFNIYHIDMLCLFAV